jgi:MFS family permease
VVETDPIPRLRLPTEIRVLAAAAFVIAIGYGLVAPALPAFARSFDVGLTAASAVVSAFALFRFAFAPLSGRLIGRIGELRTYLLGLGIVAVSTGACAFAAAYWQLLVFRSLGGIGSTMFTVSSLSMLVRLAPPAMRGRASGLWATGFLLGSVTGPLVGGGLVTFGLRAPFVVYAVMLLAAMALTGLLLRGRPETTVEAGDARPELAFRDVLVHPAYRAALAAAFANGWAVFGVRVALVPLFVVEALRRTESWAGIALAVFAAGNALTLVVAGRLADRRGRRPLILAGLAVSAASTAVLGVVPSLAAFLAVSLVAGVGSGLVNPPVNAAVADIVGSPRIVRDRDPRSRAPDGPSRPSQARGGTVLAGFQMASDIGAILGPLVAGAVAQLAGFGTAFGLTALVVVLALALWLRAPETRPPG